MWYAVIIPTRHAGSEVTVEHNLEMSDCKATTKMRLREGRTFRVLTYGRKHRSEHPWECPQCRRLVRGSA